MKVFALTVLLVSICCLEGALVKRQAEEEDPSQSEVSAPLAKVIERMQHRAEEITSFLKNQLGQDQIQELKRQTENFLQQMKSKITSLTEQLMQNTTRLFTIAAMPKQPAQEGA